MKQFHENVFTKEILNISEDATLVKMLQSSYSFMEFLNSKNLKLYSIP